ncbi:MAG: shikimate dehydrogenase [Anaerolineae bacterium]|nr:MAG: shikimate dehydrogenase [Anaerolineae bacterium]
MSYTLGLLGYPLGHSLSPVIHTAALKACGLHGTYSLFPIPPEHPQELLALLARLRAGELHGLNVTIPHKQTVLPLLDALTETAQAIGAVNTIFVRQGHLIGDNTDAPGFLADVTRFLQPLQMLAAKSALVLGAGGSARAVVYALCQAGWQVAVSTRRLEQAQGLADSLKTAHNQIEILPLDALHTWTGTLLVNTTPLGMTPHLETSPWPEGVALPKGVAVYDLVYNPPETRFVREARAAGSPATSGLGMLIEQAALAFEIWTGHSPARALLSQALSHSA